MVLLARKHAPPSGPLPAATGLRALKSHLIASAHANPHRYHRPDGRSLLAGAMGQAAVHNGRSVAATSHILLLLKRRMNHAIP
jgi:hypothetical protein